MRAKSRKAEAENALLRAVVDAIEPALPAISTRVEGLAGPLRRALLIDARRGIYLGEQGDFFEVGPMPAGIGGQGVRILDAEEVCDEVSVVAVVAVISAALNAQVGRRVERTKQIDREAAILAGIVQALRIGGAR